MKILDFLVIKLKVEDSISFFRRLIFLKIIKYNFRVILYKIQAILYGFKVRKTKNRYQSLRRKIRNKTQYNNKSNKKLKLSISLTELLPEEYINELQALEKRWQSHGLSEKEIQVKRLICKFSMFKAYIECQIQNIWFYKTKIE